MQDIETESINFKKATSARGGTGSKRSRAAEVHNLSERVSSKNLDPYMESYCICDVVFPF